MIKKRIIILEHSGGRLANQLWTFISFFAYCKEQGYDLQNYSFDYYQFFNFKTPSILIKILSTPYFRDNKIVIRFRPYRKYIDIIKKLYNKNIIDSGTEKQFYLPPTQTKDNSKIKLLKEFENNNQRKLYAINWMFRNPVGIEKYRGDIINYFKPKKEIGDKVEVFINNLRSKYKKVVGVHIRQGDYETFLNGELYFKQNEVRKILDDYLSVNKLSVIDTVFVLCSDGNINTEEFSGLNIVRGLGGVVEDLFTLAKTDIIIGSDSTFGAFASYYGNIPFIIFERPVIDWDYYSDKRTFFENKKSRVTFF